MSEPATTKASPEVDYAQVITEHIAYHEAGHALADALLNHHILWAALAPAQGLVWGGRVATQVPTLDSRQAIIEHMATYTAGLLAETLNPHQQPLVKELFDRSDDLLAIEEAMTTFFPNASALERQQLWEEAHNCAAHILELPGHTEAIHSLASTLLQQGQLAHEEVVAIILHSRSQAEAKERAARASRTARLWRWFFCGLGAVFVAEMTVFGLLTLFVNIWLLLGLTAISSCLLPLCLWKLALRRYGETEPVSLLQVGLQRPHGWSLADYGVSELENPRALPPRNRGQEQQQPPARKRVRVQYDRHRRLPQRKGSR